MKVEAPILERLVLRAWNRLVLERSRAYIPFFWFSFPLCVSDVPKRHDL